MTEPLNDVQLKQYKLLIIVLGLVFFCFSVATALLFQKLILPNMITMMASSVLILIMLSFYGHISFVDMMLALLNWMIFLTLIVALYFQSVPSVVMSIFSYAVLLFSYAKWANVNGDVYEFA